MKVLLFTLLFTTAYRISANCPDGTFSSATGNKCYFIPKGSEQFMWAEMNCIDQNANLASISNVFDNMNLTGKNYGRGIFYIQRCSIFSALHALCVYQ
jgi:hypothetical protein